MEGFIKYFATIFFIAYMLIAFVFPSVRTYKQTGINPVTFSNSDNAHDYIGRLFKILLALISITIVAYWVNGNTYQLLLPATYLEIPALHCAGVILCLLSLIWTSIAQWQMGKSWRIGIDEKNKTALISTGLFRFSRNLIFLGMKATLLGYFLLLPNAVTLLVFVSGFRLIQIQVRLEEEFLLKQHGTNYENCKRNVRRFL
jgi:protein-S-isoprenylcysteine O-methyltransferase Ste14